MLNVVHVQYTCGECQCRMKSLSIGINHIYKLICTSLSPSSRIRKLKKNFDFFNKKLMAQRNSAQNSTVV